MIALLTFMILVLNTEAAVSSPLSQALLGIFEENNIKDDPATILHCISDTDSQKIIDFIAASLRKGAQGNPAEIISLVDDLHAFYDRLPNTLKTCLYRNEQLLSLNYKYGIGYLPLAEQQFINYTRSQFLAIHKVFTELDRKWNTQKQYKQAGLAVAAFGHQLYPINKKNIRGVWLTNVASEALDSLQNIQKAIEQCRRAHLNTIFVVVYNNARTIYPSTVMQRLIGIKQQEKFQGRDPLRQLIDTASLKGIQVHAWFQYGFSSSYSAQGGPIVARHPQWKALDVDGNLVMKNGFDWLNGFDPEVQQFIIDLIKQVIINYKVTGVQGDDRLPALPSIAGYEPYTVELYKAEHQGKEPPADHLDKEWVAWRVGKLNDFMHRLYLQVKGVNPYMYLSVSPSPYPWSVQQYLQEWPTWVKYGWVDAVIPQCYRYNQSAYNAVLEQQISYFVNPKVSFVAGVLLSVGNYTANVTFLEGIVSKNREMEVDGQSFFYYEGVVRQKEWFQNAYKQKMGLTESIT